MYETDDSAFRLPFIWKGAPEMPWWFEARGVMWIIASVLSIAFTVVAFLILPGVLFSWLIVPVFITKLLAALLVGVSGAVMVTRWFGKHVKPVTPIRHHVTTVGREMRTPRPNPQGAYHLTTLPDATYVEAHDAVLYVTTPDKDTHA